MPLLFWLDVVALSLSAVFATALALIVLGSGPRRALNRTFALFTLMEAAWALSSLLLRLTLWLEQGDPVLWSELATLIFSLMGPFLLMFTIRYVDHPPRWPDLIAILGLVAMAVLCVPLFQHRLVFNPRLDANGSTMLELSTWALALATVPALYLVWSLILFRRGGHRVGEPYLALSVLTLIAGFVVGGLLEVPFPVVSVTNTLGVAVLGYGVISRQLFNPLRELTAELEHKVEALRESEARYRSLFEDSPISLWEEDFSEVKRYIDGLRDSGVSDFGAYFNKHPEAVSHCANMVKILDVNQVTLELFQAENKETLHEGLGTIFSQESLGIFREELIVLAEGGTWFESETVQLTLRGDIMHAALSLAVAPGYEATWSKVFVSIIDITERKHLEDQLRQAQKMEAIGRLAGGVAHDFNNLLTAITGYTELLLSDFPIGTPIRVDLEEIKKAADRATTLTSQLLAFSRRQMLQPKILDLNAVVTNTGKMLRRLIGEDIELITVLAPTLGQVKADPGQIQQVIMNLAVNARDAMPQGGKLTIETANVRLDEAYARGHANVQPGPYVMLAVSDTGLGMDEETQAHLFEPFFTTKERGKSTGLGLATIYGIVRQTGGYIYVYSEPGQGTTFKIYLPRIKESAATLASETVRTGPPQGSEIILLVEDEDVVRNLARRVLLRSGYTVLEACHAEEAIQVHEQQEAPIHLMVTDVVMPGGMSGRDLARHLMEARPEMRVLYISGYTDNAIVHHGVLEAGVAFLQKPFTPDALARKVREVLDEPQQG